MKKEALAEAKEELKKQMKQDLYKPSMEELSEMHKGIMQILKAGITFQYQRMFKKDKEGKLLKDAQGNLILET